VLVASLWISQLVGWLLVLVRRSVSRLDDRSIGEFSGCVVGELGCLVGWLDGWLEVSVFGWLVCQWVWWFVGSDCRSVGRLVGCLVFLLVI
jgi:hypothetical protein